MKHVLAALVLLILTPVLLLGLLAGAWAIDEDDSCVGENIQASSQQCWNSSTGVGARPFTGARGYTPDPTSDGRITARMLHTCVEAMRVFDWPWGVGCWDPHEWNPTSDHPRGRACDFAVGRLGSFPAGSDREKGWELARWFRREAGVLGVDYVIFDGRIWSEVRSSEGWRAYTGGGIYDPSDPTGGHFDHVHVSVREN